MIVRFEQSGGWGNPLGQVCELDTDKLGAADARTLRELVQRANVSKTRSARSGAARDATIYRLHIEGEGATVDLELDDSTLPESLEPLVEFLRRHARPRTGK